MLEPPAGRPSRGGRGGARGGRGGARGGQRWKRTKARGMDPCHQTFVVSVKDGKVKTIEEVYRFSKCPSRSTKSLITSPQLSWWVINDHVRSKANPSRSTYSFQGFRHYWWWSCRAGLVSKWQKSAPAIQWCHHCCQVLNHPCPFGFSGNHYRCSSHRPCQGLLQVWFIPRLVCPGSSWYRFSLCSHYQASSPIGWYLWRLHLHPGRNFHLGNLCSCRLRCHCQHFTPTWLPDMWAELPTFLPPFR